MVDKGSMRVSFSDGVWIASCADYECDKTISTTIELKRDAVKDLRSRGWHRTRRGWCCPDHSYKRKKKGGS